MPELMALLAPILFALMIGTPVAALLWFARRQDAQKAHRKGFDVSPPKGPTHGDERN